MKRMLMLNGALVVLLLVPSLAMATHITGLDANANCEGWTADLGMVFREDVFEADVEFTITLFNSMDEELESFEYSGTLTRNPDGPQTVMYNFAGEWQETHYSDSMIVVINFHVTAVGEEGLDESFADEEIALACTVDNDQTTWSAMKALYQ